MRLLVVEDDAVISEGLRRTLSKEGYQVDVARDGQDGIDMAMVGSYATIILDIMLPKKDGWAVCESLRRSKVSTPILMLTARDQVGDRVKGLDLGADDYLPKPFDFSELLARVRALVRRDKANRGGILHVRDIQIDPATKTASRNGEPLHLTRREYTLFEALARNQGRTLTRELIIDEIWADDQSLSNTVNFHVTSLRKKIDGGYDQSLIETVHGFGYRLRSLGE